MRTSVAIVGGGLSGLRMASLLQQAGIDYCLLEARERLGGRILGQPAADQQGSYDLGPSWIWPGQPRVARLIADAGLSLYPQYSQGELVYEDFDASVRRLDFATMAGALRLNGGIETLIDGLADSLPAERKLLQHPVTQIEQQVEGYVVTVNTSDAAAPLKINADQVVLAVPPRVIASQIVFQPELPEAAMQSMRAVPTWMGSFIKVVVEYPQPFWRDMQLSGDAMSRIGPLQEIHDASVKGSRHGALFGFIRQTAVTSIDENELKQQVTAQLTGLFGPSAAQPLSIWIKNWSADIYSAGPTDITDSPDGHPVYGLPLQLQQLAKQGLVFIATEMAHQHGGLIEGALEAADAGFQQIQVLQQAAV